MPPAPESRCRGLWTCRSRLCQLSRSSSPIWRFWPSPPRGRFCGPLLRLSARCPRILRPQNPPCGLNLFPEGHLDHCADVVHLRQSPHGASVSIPLGPHVSGPVEVDVKLYHGDLFADGPQGSPSGDGYGVVSSHDRRHGPSFQDPSDGVLYAAKRVLNVSVQDVGVAAVYYFDGGCQELLTGVGVKESRPGRTGLKPLLSFWVRAALLAETPSPCRKELRSRQCRRQCCHNPPLWDFLRRSIFP